MNSISVIYQDNFLIVLDKPRDIHVHPTKLSRGELSLKDILQRQCRCEIHPAHRLDRPVGGILLAAKNTETARLLGQMMRTHGGVDKRYLCIVRGWMSGSGRIDRPLRQASGKPEKESVTLWRSLAQAEAPWPDEQFPSSRYTLLECTLITGRHHQIRRHLAFESHPILGDIARGDNTRNRIWKAHTRLEGLMLRAQRLSFIHPHSGERLSLTAPPDPRFISAADMFGWERELVVQ
ncbi:MAG: hypothetical protein B0D92_02480 [Spirochaeta sp. LUC14_002_19_P3]|nr:MAG: hypothetical protein B0D92_02480 [Spirochaeta sp. LUC14_002_19_P3]